MYIGEKPSRSSKDLPGASIVYFSASIWSEVVLNPLVPGKLPLWVDESGCSLGNVRKSAACPGVTASEREQPSACTQPLGSQG